MLINKLISLGRNCFTRTVLSRWGVKGKKADGEISFPFDCCSCSTEAVRQMIKNDFKNFFNFDDLKDRKIFKNTLYNVEFNHDTDIYPDKEALIERYKRRIDNFRNLWNKPDDKILFVLATIPDINNFEMLVQNLKGMLPKESYLAWISIDKKDYTQEFNALNLANTFYAFVPHPYPKYWGEWYDQKFYSTKDGTRFEHAFCNAVNEIYKKIDPTYTFSYFND